jgi:ferredoxin
MATLKEEVVSVARGMGIHKVGFTSKERLQDAPPSGDLGYILPSARSAISLAVALDKPAIRAFLSKEDQMAHVNDHKQSYAKLNQAARALQGLLRDRGYEAATPYPNFDYRKGLPFMTVAPPLSHRYVAVASGIGWLGRSGSVITPEYGATVSLSSVVTSAELEPDPLAVGDICQDCRLCVATCPSHFLSKGDDTTISIGGRIQTHNKKAHNLRCLVTCGGANGVSHPDAKWSTWSYKVLDLPEPSGNDEAFVERVLEHSKDPGNRLLRATLDAEKLDIRDFEEFDRFFDKVPLTCGSCMLICWPDMKDRQENYRLLTTSGRVVKDETGIRVVRSELPPQAPALPQPPV